MPPLYIAEKPSCNYSVGTNIANTVSEDTSTVNYKEETEHSGMVDQGTLQFFIFLVQNSSWLLLLLIGLSLAAACASRFILRKFWILFSTNTGTYAMW